jgi:transcriptional/translational regulatory protein YebC/TACO1
MFETKGHITIERNQHDPDELFMLAVEAGAEDVEINEDTFEIYTASTDLHTVSQALSEAGLELEETVLSEVPKNEIELGQKETIQVMGVIEALEELDDIDQVYSGLMISDEALAELQTP